jgi:hypothetical protein
MAGSWEMRRLFAFRMKGKEIVIFVLLSRGMIRHNLSSSRVISERFWYF